MGVIGWVSVLIVAGACGVALLGTLRPTHLATVSRETTACPEVIWKLLADVPGRTRWDSSLDRISLDGPFEVGSTGQVTLRGQPTRPFTLALVDEPRRYVDRFELPAGASMDFDHRLTRHGHSTRVTFTVSMRGPTSVPTAFFVRPLLEKDLPNAVETLISLAESEDPARCPW